MDSKSKKRNWKRVMMEAKALSASTAVHSCSKIHVTIDGVPSCWKTQIISTPGDETDELIFAAAPICEETAPMTGTTAYAQYLAVSEMTLAVFVMPFKMGLMTLAPIPTAFVTIEPHVFVCPFRMNVTLKYIYLTAYKKRKSFQIRVTEKTS